ncbi:MAG: hypothetical protein WAQ28_09080 [Bacteroidia bacterium]
METKPNMELVFKRPKGKAPCICVLFETDYIGGRYNKIVVDHYHKYPFTIKFEFENEKLNMILKTKDYNFEWKYEGLKYTPEKFYKFLYDTKDVSSFSFCHIALKNSNHEVLRTPVNRLLWVLKINTVELVKEY